MLRRIKKLQTFFNKQKFLLAAIGAAMALSAAIIIIRLPLAKAALDLAEQMGPQIRASEILVKTAVLLGTGDAKLSFYAGLWYHKNHQLVKAEKFYKKAAALDPKIANARYQLARVYFIQRRFQPALAEINDEIAVNPANLRSFYIRGLIFGYMGKNKEAEADFKTFIKSPLSKQTNGWGGYNDLAWILMKEKKYEEALSALKEAEKIFAPNTWIYNGLGGAYLALKNYDLARDYYKKAYAGAQKMTVEEWLSAYPAHDPKTAEDGIKQIITNIEKNLELATKMAAENSD